MIINAEVCWENGVPLYEGNFIYSEKSIVNSIENIYITWVELDNGYRKLKLQKTDFAGEPIWTDPVTIDQNLQFMLETDIVESDNNGCFINAHYQSRSNQKLYKIDSNGNLLWQYSHNSYYIINLLPLENGGILLSEIDDHDNNNVYYLKCIYISESGEVHWDNDQLFIFQSLNRQKILEQQYVDGYFYFLLSEDENCFVIKVSEAGELISQSDSFSIGSYTTTNFINNSFFVFYINYDTSDLEMHNFDLSGTSLLSVDPKIICNTYNWKADEFLFSDDYFYSIVTNSDENLVFHKCNFQGEILNTFAHNDEIYYYILQVYDQNVDFISCVKYHPTLDSYLLRLNENGISEPIHYLPDNSNHFWGGKYFLEENFSFAGAGLISGESAIYTMRKTENNTEVYTVRDIENEIISPKIKKNDTDLTALWPSYERNSIMIQEYNENGIPQYQTNGDVLIEGYQKYFVVEDKIITIGDTLTNSDVTMNCYNFNGEHLWSDQFAGVYNDYYVFPFYDDYIFIFKETIQEPVTQHIIKFITFDENGLLWPESITLEMTEPLTFGNIMMKGNILFFQSYHTVYRVLINSNGTYTEPQILANNSDMINLYGNEDKFFAITKDGVTSMRKFHYFQDGVLMWDDAWEVYIGDYVDLKTIFEDDGFYLIGYNYPNSVNIDKFDYEHNIIEESSFDYTSQNPILASFDFYEQSGKFIFIFNSMLDNYDHQFSYMITDLIGNILLPEFAETIMQRDNIEFSNHTLFSDNCLYMPIACGYKPLEGNYERNFYIQKIDLSDYVSIDNKIISNTHTKLTCYPNPFNPETTIKFSLQNDFKVELTIYNIKGQKITTLINQRLKKGKHSHVWSGKDEVGKSVSSGVYFYKIKLDGKRESTKKCLLLK